MIAQRVRGTRQLAPEEGFVTRLPIRLEGPGTYEVGVRLSDTLKLDAVVSVPKGSPN